jgi:hypothetical protein
MADKKKTLEITGLFCRELVRQLADKDRGSEIRSRKSETGGRKTEIGIRESSMEIVSEKSVAELAAWAKSPGILRVFQAAIRRPRGRVEMTLERLGRCEEEWP